LIHYVEPYVVNMCLQLKNRTPEFTETHVMIKKILIADDSLVARMMIENSIPDDKEYEVMIAADGNEGVETFQKFNPDVTFMDLTMLLLDGFKATEKIMAFGKNAVVVAETKNGISSVGFLLEKADKALNKAKETGRNKIVAMT
jgi:PleD family two-component response regulator